MDYGRGESERVLRTLSDSIYSNIKNYTEISRLIMTQEQLVTFLRADTSEVDISMINDARYGIMSILNVKEDVDTVIILREDMIQVATNRFTYNYDYDLMNSMEWRKDIYAGLGRAVVSLNCNGVASKGDKSPVVTIGRAIYDIDSQDRTGLMLMNISPRVFQRMLYNVGYNDVCIMGDDGTFLAGNRELAECFGPEFTTDRIAHKDMGVGSDLKLVSGCRVKELPIVILRTSAYGPEGIPFRMVYVLLFLMATFIIVAAIVGIYIKTNITNPVFELSDSMEKNKQSGELKKINVDMPYSELDMLENDYNRMIDHVNELIATLIDKEKNLQRAEMRVLNEQIKPHFLYNSIETIGFLALDAGADNVHDALETLGSFYRNFLSKGGREIPLSREICIVKDYLSLQRLRYGDILQDEYDIDPDTEKYIVPKLILQPLVENSIYHGIRLKGEPGVISIKSRLEDEKLHLTVMDTGVGMSQEQIEKILSKDGAGVQQDEESFGLWGTIQRIRIYCGREDVVKITSEPGEYTEIEFII
ncbi:MAG: sensor histidine kinase [Butyrivibrio sp.]|nr:sensor histidine kinase [Butyrivibrio sp.]